MNNTTDRVNETASRVTPLKQEYRRFFQANQSVMLGTVDRDGNPDTSYACFEADKWGRFCVLVSGYSKHTANMHDNPQVSAMFVEDEAQAEEKCASPGMRLAGSDLAKDARTLDN